MSLSTELWQLPMDGLCVQYSLELENKAQTSPTASLCCTLRSLVVWNFSATLAQMDSIFWLFSSSNINKPVSRENHTITEQLQHRTRPLRSLMVQCSSRSLFALQTFHLFSSSKPNYLIWLPPLLRGYPASPKQIPMQYFISLLAIWQLLMFYVPQLLNYSRETMYPSMLFINLNSSDQSFQNHLCARNKNMFFCLL